jgi:hypothetical protein
MRKIVINACFGGFGLSEAGMQHYAKLKGLTLYPERDEKYAALDIVTYWLVPPEQRHAQPSGEAWPTLTMDERRAFNKAYDEQVLTDRDIPRDDPMLVQTVEELGAAASGRHAELKVVEIPDDVSWVIDEYDGSESVEEAHRSWS